MQDEKQEIEVLEYPAADGAAPAAQWDGWVEAAEEVQDAEAAEGKAAQWIEDRKRVGRWSGAKDVRSEPGAEQAKRAFEAGREQGRQEGGRAERDAMAAALQVEQKRYQHQLAGLVSHFTEESGKYLHAVEQEVVKLALAIAARVLRHEAQVDPLLLTGAVRVALGQLAAASEVRLSVPATEVDLWKETMALIPKMAVKPEVVAGDGMRAGECMIESKLGAVDLGVRSQLREIENSLLDRAKEWNGPQSTADGEQKIGGTGEPILNARA